MPLFLIERNFAEQLEVNRDDVLQVTQVNTDVGIQWLFSFLSADKKKTYCLYEAPNAEAIREAAQRLNVPADVIIEVGELRPEMFVRDVSDSKGCEFYRPAMRAGCYPRDMRLRSAESTCPITDC